MDQAKLARMQASVRIGTCPSDIFLLSISPQSILEISGPGI